MKLRHAPDWIDNELNKIYIDLENPDTELEDWFKLVQEFKDNYNDYRIQATTEDRYAN